MGDHADAENRAARYRAGIDDASEPEQPAEQRRGRRPEDQVLGGPPVVTPLRDIEDEVASWHERRRRT